MNTNALNRLMTSRGRGGVLVCDVCGSPDVQETAWVHANHLTYASAAENPRDDSDRHWCPDCDREGREGNVRFTTLDEFERRMDAEIGALDGSVSAHVRMKRNWKFLPYLAKRKVWLSMQRPMSPKDLNRPSCRLQTMREQMTDEISSFLRRWIPDCPAGMARSLAADDVEDGSAPILQADPLDDNNTYTLGGITLDGDGVLHFSGGNCGDICEWGEEDIPTDVLVNVAEWLADNERTVAENRIEAECFDLDISDAEERLRLFGELTGGDEKIDDGLDGDEDKYLMMRSYDLAVGAGGKRFHVRLYFGDASRDVTLVEVGA